MTLGQYHQFMMEHVFRPFQREVVEAVISGNRVGILGSRQIGKSYALAYCAILLACGWEGSKGHDVKIISETDKKAKRIIDDVHKHLDKMETVVGPLRQPNRGGVAEVVLKNGSHISAMVGKPSALQAWSGSVIVDEFSLSRFDLEELLAQALIVASSASHLRTVIATNADRDGSFVHRFWHTNKRDGSWKLLEYNIYDVYPQGLPDQIDQIRKTIHPQLWSRFFLNQFTSGLATCFEPELIDASQGATKPGGVKVIGFDPGFSRHASGIVVCSVSDALSVHEELVLWDTTVEDQIDHIARLMAKWDATKVVVDQGVGGLVVKQLMQNRFGHGAVKPMSVNRNKYEIWRRQLERLMMEGKLHIDPQCQHLVQDLKTLELDDRGFLKVPERVWGKQVTHCDTAVALMMVTEMLDTPPVGGQMQSVTVEHTFGKFF
jgi:phage FluMu gp28-like protein